MQKYPNVDAFRNDNKQRIVLWYGGVTNTHNMSFKMMRDMIPSDIWS